MFVGGTNNTISDNEVKNCVGNGIYLPGDSNFLQNNIIESNNDVGIFVSGSHNTILGNTISKHLNSTHEDYAFGIRVWNADNNNITGNTISNNGAGIKVSDSSQTYIAFNKIENNTSTGIDVVGNLNYVLNNTLSKNGKTGIYINYLLNALPPNYVSGNLVTGSEDGISSSGNNSITWNDLIDNKNNVGSPIGFWDYNLYSDYNGTDANGDGIGDTPYIIDNGPYYEPTILDMHPRTSHRRIEGSGINLLIVPINLQDSTITHSKTYYDEIAKKMTQYFKEVSYGTLDLKVTVHQNTDGSWVTLPKTSTANYKSETIRQLFFGRRKANGRQS